MELKDCCMHCNQEYPLTVDNAAVQIFLRTPLCNYLNATCTLCNGVTRIFLVMESVCGLIDSLPIYVFADAPEEVIASAKKIGVIVEPLILEDLPDLPPQLRRELYDWFREEG